MKWICARVGAVVATVGVLGLLTNGRAWATEEHSAERGKEGTTAAMSKFYSGPVGKVGNFPGRLLCLRCDIKPGPGAMSQCEKEGHHHALSMDGDLMIHPLLPATKEVQKQINSGELHAKDVVVHGKYYPATGAILSIELRRSSRAGISGNLFDSISGITTTERKANVRECMAEIRVGVSSHA